MPIRVTRTLLGAALDGSLNGADFRLDPNFGFEVPVAVPGVESGILDPRSTWADPAAYDAQAQRLVSMFVENFARFSKRMWTLRSFRPRRGCAKQPDASKTTPTSPASS